MYTKRVRVEGNRLNEAGGVIRPKDSFLELLINLVNNNNVQENPQELEQDEKFDKKFKKSLTKSLIKI
jgi:hypothetical protein